MSIMAYDDKVAHVLLKLKPLCHYLHRPINVCDRLAAAEKMAAAFCLLFCRRLFFGGSCIFFSVCFVSSSRKPVVRQWRKR